MASRDAQPAFIALKTAILCNDLFFIAINPCFKGLTVCIFGHYSYLCVKSQRDTALAVTNIQTSLILPARLSVPLHKGEDIQICLYHYARHICLNIKRLYYVEKILRLALESHGMDSR